MEQVQWAAELAQEEARVEAVDRDGWVNRALVREVIVFALAVALKYPTRPAIPVTISVAQNAAQRWCGNKKWPDLK